MIQSVDHLALAQEIDRQAGKANRRMPVLLQVNIAREPQKGGVREEELLPLLMKDKLLAKGVSHLLSSQLTRILRTHAAMSVLGHGLLRGAGLGGPVGAALNGVKAVSGSAYRVTIPAVLQIACLRRMVSATQV